MKFLNIPAEMRELNQWLLWRYEKTETPKPTKVPYIAEPDGGKASVVNEKHRRSFADGINAPLHSLVPVDRECPTNFSGYSGIGFVLTNEDPYLIIDCDNTGGDASAQIAQNKIYNLFDSYTELSPSGLGVHIIIKAKIPRGRRRSFVELYSAERYMTMTGDVVNNKHIREAHEVLSNGLTVQQSVDILFEQMGGKAVDFSYGDDQPQKEDDLLINERAAAALNGEKYSHLYNGNWQQYYTSQSEGDFALIDILAFYTQNIEQITRMFRASELGKREKAQRDDYVGYMIRKAFDRQLPPVDIDGLRIAWENMNIGIGEAGNPGEPESSADVPASNGKAARPSVSSDIPDAVKPFPPGLLGEVAQYILDASPRPVREIALAGAIGFLSGIAGRAYNTYTGSGLNQYILLLAPTGTGKDAISDGVSKIFDAVQLNVPAAKDFRGPGELVSSAGLIRWMEKKPCCISILGEIGLMMQQMASPNANTHIKGLQRVLTQMYSKSGKGKTFDPSAYSDKEKNTDHVKSPSLTLVGESVPGEFYSALDENLISNGLLPRFCIFEYTGSRPYYQEGKEFVKPSFSLVQSVTNLMAQSATLGANGNFHAVEATGEAQEKFRQFDKWTTDQINKSGANEVLRHLWNRAHLKALKLASIYAIGMNYLNPVVDLVSTDWATNMIVEQTYKLIDKFENNEVGQLQGGEDKQMQDLLHAVVTFMDSPHDKYAKYGGTAEMHKDGVFTQSHVQRRLVSMSSFRQDRLGASNAIKRALNNLLEGDDLRELPTAQMQAKYGIRAKAYCVMNPSRFYAARRNV
jgi:hypothetical protein